MRPLLARCFSHRKSQVKPLARLYLTLLKTTRRNSSMAEA
jgi:hypothetical protein